MKILHEWNSHLEIFSLPQVIEHSRQYLLLRTDILQKTVIGCPWYLVIMFFTFVHLCILSSLFSYLNVPSLFYANKAMHPFNRLESGQPYFKRKNIASKINYLTISTSSWRTSNSFDSAYARNPPMRSEGPEILMVE